MRCSITLRIDPKYMTDKCCNKEDELWKHPEQQTPNTAAMIDIYSSCLFLGNSYPKSTS